MAEQTQYENKCIEAIMSNDYIDLIIQYEGSLENEIIRLEPECIHILDDKYAVFHILLAERSVFEVLDEFDLPLSSVPIVVGPYGKSAMEASGILQIQTNPYIPLRGNGILIGVIDSGIDYTHRVFTYEDNTTKIVSIWDQTIHGNPPGEMIYGTEYTREQINEALASENPHDIVLTRDLTGHGTFIAGSAAGREVIEEDFIGAAPDAELVVVKLKEAKEVITSFYSIYPQEGEPVYESVDIMMGINYITQKARALNKPLVCILGLGSNLGSHDGLDNFSMYIQRVGERIGNIMVVAAGNEANLGHHYKGIFAQGETYKNVEINVAREEKGFYLNIWSTTPDILSIAITSPTGEYISRIAPRVTIREEFSFVFEVTTITVTNILLEPQTGDQLIFVRFNNPTEGIWTLTVFGDLVVSGRFDIWMNRAGWILEETRFLQPDVYTTVSDPANAIENISIGAYNHKTDSIYINSGRGLTRDEEVKPDIVAPGVDVYGALPVNTFGYMTGTSVSAAITGGACALLLEWGILLGNDLNIDSLVAINYLKKGAERDEDLNYPNREWGFGELDFLGILEYYRET